MSEKKKRRIGVDPAVYDLIDRFTQHHPIPPELRTELAETIQLTIEMTLQEQEEEQ